MSYKNKKTKPKNENTEELLDQTQQDSEILSDENIDDNLDSDDDSDDDNDDNDAQTSQNDDFLNHQNEDTDLNDDTDIYGQNDSQEFDNNFIEENLLNDNEINEKIVSSEERMTFDRLTRYELVRIIGTRRKQLVMNAKPLVKGVENLDEKQIAIEELKKGMIPYFIFRSCPNGNIEKWCVNELKHDHLLNILE